MTDEMAIIAISLLLIVCSFLTNENGLKLSFILMSLLLSTCWIFSLI